MIVTTNELRQQLEVTVDEASDSVLEELILDATEHAENYLQRPGYMHELLAGTTGIPRGIRRGVLMLANDLYDIERGNYTHSSYKYTGAAYRYLEYHRNEFFY